MARFRIRFMPSSPGEYAYSITYRQGAFENPNWRFTLPTTSRRGPIRVDPKYPWHFIWEGTGEHYFFNGTTAFWLVGWRDESTIRYSIERLLKLKINRLRVLFAGNANIFWGEPVMTGDNFSYALRPWIAEKPQSFDQPGIDFTRFNIPYWQKWERMLRFSRDRDMIISVIQDISMHKAQPVEYSEDERRYLRYMVTRLSAFSNVTYDLGDDMDSFRDEKWVHATGILMESWDPYKHLATSHPVHRENQDRGSAWFGFTSIQDWRRPQHPLMLEEREIQKKTGRIIPQTNEEYGYEDHYPHWAPGPGSDSSETAAYGRSPGGRVRHRWANAGAPTSGGHGAGGSTVRRRHHGLLRPGMVDFFTGFQW
jgi:hypothetical protein